jgi:signal transduction histidine kinase
VDLHWDTKEPRDYASEAHLREKYLKQLSEDLSTFSRLWIQTRKRIEAETKARILLKTRGGLLGRVAVVAQLAHTWRDEIAESQEAVRNLKHIRDKNDFEKAVDHLSNRLKEHKDEAEKFLGLAEKTRLQPRPIDVRTLLDVDDNVSEIYSKRFRDKSIPVQMDFEQNHVLYVTPITMKLAFQNIVDNAIKYSAEVPDPLLRISVRQDGDRLFVRFANNGKPIDEKTQDIINNDRYEELDRKWGLVIAKCFAQYDDGDLRIENPEGGGAALVFSLRLAQEALTDESTTTGSREPAYTLSQSGFNSR